MGQKRKHNSDTIEIATSLPSPATASNVLQGLLDINVGLIAVEADHSIIFINTQFLSLTGLATAQPGSFCGQTFSDLFPDAPIIADADTAQSASFTDAAGRPWAITWTRNPTGGWIGTLSPASAQPSALSDPGMTDDLTGLGNRVYLRHCFERLSRQPRAGCPDVVALYLDLDRFKPINDTFSHATGDGLLRKTADRLRSSLRQEDIIARVGGDEFVILLTGRDDAASEDVARRIAKLIARPFLVDGKQLTIGISIGLARLSPEAPCLDTVLQQADIALYESKNAGRGGFQWFQSHMQERLLDQQQIENDLKKAVLLEQFELLFQPQMLLDSTKITGFEALIRWHHPERGLITPDKFIHIAEQTGSIVPLGAWVLRKACETACDWPANLSVAVNVSPVQFEHESFINTVQLVLQSTNLDPSRLELEITETALLNNVDLVRARIEELRAQGVKISLDDFGIGYSSLNYLRQYPFDKVKIDQSFVREPLADQQASHIIGAVAQLGVAFGMNVLAEGVETREQLSKIRDQGCSSVQGYFLSKPISADAVDDFLKTTGGDAAFTTPPQEGEKEDDRQ
ncbi:EAL domain-containing protein [uncultured Roseobacter sp.]|uniref:putative bifunctional diguanylate cyclase/phosphodiesterase n=1 Tax=uncultured Roseobacter sp. TaxID=114847 RepID=UPI00260171B3|nr:EAL domain-containing protein [uncultured Roseobacter sp.]